MTLASAVPDARAESSSSLAPSAWLAGATGLVGQELLQRLLADPRYGQVHAIGRRAPPLQHERLRAHGVDFTRLPALPPARDAYIALGTTIKVAGSQAAFRAVDLDAVLAVARAARQAGVSRLGVVSAMDANAQSWVFYNRVKGEMEAGLAGLGFETLVIARPSLLLGSRSGLAQPPRFGEHALQWGMRALRPLIPADYRAIHAQDVARALEDAVLRGAPGLQLLSSGAMQPR